ncbi:hypothetical protein K438DRAFT_1959534 [Mycena galopus ATCC 62051]|nr:hypothetical protein K438DRAFT_1959534 [Mycena galopus ATCC 62051]
MLNLHTKKHTPSATTARHTHRRLRIGGFKRASARREFTLNGERIWVGAAHCHGLLQAEPLHMLEHVDRERLGVVHGLHFHLDNHVHITVHLLIAFAHIHLDITLLQAVSLPAPESSDAVA